MTDEPNEPRTHERAEELQMEACLTELGGVGPDRALASRILAAIAERDGNGRVIAIATGTPRWLLAAFVVVGLSVVGGIALMRSQPDKQNTAAPVLPPDSDAPDLEQQEPMQPNQPAPTPKPGPITTLIADYSENRIIEIDSSGAVIFELNQIFGAWDVETLANNNLLVTEFSVSRVCEYNRQGKVIWSYDKLKNPYSAQRLKNGNTLIADTFASRVIEVTPNGEIAWLFDQDLRPFDAEVTSSGTVLIADVQHDRIIEVDRAGKIVWELANVPNAHDADLLANGNTLVTLRNQGQVIEVDADGKVVWELGDLSSPSDADRLPNGNTLVAESNQVREFDQNKKVVWSKAMAWAVEVNRGPR